MQEEYISTRMRINANQIELVAALSSLEQASLCDKPAQFKESIHPILVLFAGGFRSSYILNNGKIFHSINVGMRSAVGETMCRAVLPYLFCCFLLTGSAPPPSFADKKICIHSININVGSIMNVSGHPGAFRRKEPCLFYLCQVFRGHVSIALTTILTVNEWVRKAQEKRDSEDYGMNLCCKFNINSVSFNNVKIVFYTYTMH